MEIYIWQHLWISTNHLWRYLQYTCGYTRINLWRSMNDLSISINGLWISINYLWISTIVYVDLHEWFCGWLGKVYWPISMVSTILAIYPWISSEYNAVWNWIFLSVTWEWEMSTWLNHPWSFNQSRLDFVFVEIHSLNAFLDSQIICEDPQLYWWRLTIVFVNLHNWICGSPHLNRGSPQFYCGYWQIC